MIKNLFQCNIIRTGHYPNHPLFYELCDRLGLIVHTEIPSWQIERDFVQSEEAWNLWLKPQLEAMVKTLKNYTSIAFWGVSNEQYGTPLYNERAVNLVRELDKSRFITIVGAATSDLQTNKLVDVTARNFHYGWYHSRSVYDLRGGFHRVIEAADNKPVWVAELGAHGISGRLTGSYGDQSRGSETYQDGVVRFGLQYCAAESDLIAGITVWTLTDFYRSGRIEPHGILSENWRPKLAAYTVRNLFNSDLRLFILEDNALCQPDSFWKASLRYFNLTGKEMKNLTARWRILNGGNEITGGQLNFDVTSDRAGEIGVIHWDIPSNAEQGLYTCWVEMADADGKWLYTNSSPFSVGKPAPPGILNVQVSINGQPHRKAYALFYGIKIPIYQFPGLIIPLPEGSYNIRFISDGLKEVSREANILSGRSTNITVDFP